MGRIAGSGRAGSNEGVGLHNGTRGGVLFFGCGAMRLFFFLPLLCFAFFEFEFVNHQQNSHQSRAPRTMRSVNQREAAVNLSLLLHSEYARSLVIQLISHFHRFHNYILCNMYYVLCTMYYVPCTRSSLGGTALYVLLLLANWLGNLGITMRQRDQTQMHSRVR